jgi:hypothetical protein
VTFTDRLRLAGADDVAVTGEPELRKALPPTTTLTVTVISREGLFLQ